MQLFISWSGEDSRKLANEFRNWIPLVLQAVDPFMSSKDISLGSKWNETINDKLEKSAMGLIFVTPDNINSPWLNFESGALSKSLDVSQKVIPIVFGDKEPAVLLSEGPLKQFQSVIMPTKDNFLELVKVINNECDKSLNPDLVKKVFDKWWGSLEEPMNQIIGKMKVEKDKPKDVKTAQDNVLNQELLLSISGKMDELTYRTNFLMHDKNQMNPRGLDAFTNLQRSRIELEHYLDEQRANGNELIRLRKISQDIIMAENMLSGVLLN